MSADVTLHFHLHQQQPLSGPLVESAAASKQDLESHAWIVVESATDITTAARGASSRMIDLLVERGASARSMPICCAAWPCTCG